ncbi:hypothetical protein Avbf_10463 [Armadillidium vulgare]|nr:hypothetical protein Avbf_10463 [Armadillidium vulgare]
MVLILASPSLKTGQHVPLSRILTKLFNLEGMLEKAASYMNDKNGTLLSDFKDGSLWEKKLRSLRLKSKYVFPICIYFDEFETGNALGSKAGIHRLGAVYATLKCFPPKLNSHLENIFLVQLFYSHDRIMAIK